MQDLILPLFSKNTRETKLNDFHINQGDKEIDLVWQ